MSIESQRKNFYLFLFKILKASYPNVGDEWLNTKRILQANGRRNIPWKRILNHLIREATIRGPISNQWHTIIRQLEILQNIQNYMRDLSGREVIKWRNQQDRARFISICEDKFPVVVSEVRATINTYPSYYSQQLLDDLHDSLWGNQFALNQNINTAYFQEEEEKDEKESNDQSYFPNTEEINQGIMQTTQISNNTNGIAEEEKLNQLELVGQFSLFNTNHQPIDNQTVAQNAFELNYLNVNLREENSPLIGEINEPINNLENTRRLKDEIKRLKEENEKLRKSLKEILSIAAKA